MSTIQLLYLLTMTKNMAFGTTEPCTYCEQTKKNRIQNLETKGLF